MVYEIIIGRSAKDRERFGLKGTILLGKHYVKMGQITSLSNEIYLDVNTSHVVFICGKRGSGKSYTLGVIAEGAANLPKETAENVCMIMLDTMGVYWTMKYPNLKDAELLKQWGLEGKGLDVVIYTPTKYYKEYKEKGIPTDHPFAILPSQLAPVQWHMAFEMDPNSPAGILIERVVLHLLKEKSNFSIDEIIKAVQKDEKSEKHAKDLVENQFLRAKDWGVFSTKATPIEEFLKPGIATILDVSLQEWNVRNLMIGILSREIYQKRISARREEELAIIGGEEIKKVPMTWMIFDEVHNFIPSDSETAATHDILTLIKQGRQPGISLVLITQRPNKLHEDAISQSDLVISHRLTAKPDLDALSAVMQTYLLFDIRKSIGMLPKLKGVAVILDDNSERLFNVQVRPRQSWHAGESPVAIKEKAT